MTIQFEERDLLRAIIRADDDARDASTASASLSCCAADARELLENPSDAMIEFGAMILHRKETGAFKWYSESDAIRKGYRKISANFYQEVLGDK